jgi:hypothetical protein
MNRIEYGFNPRPLGYQVGYHEPYAIRRIDELAQLEDRWHFGAGSRPSDGVLASAKMVASFAMSCGIFSLDVFPTKDGEVTVVLYIGEDDHSFQVQRDLSFRYWNEADPESDIQEDLTLPDVIQRINALSKPSWNLFSSFISGTGIVTADASAVKRFTIRATGVVYLSSNTIAYYTEPSDVFANKPADSTQQLVQNLQSSGGSRNRSCQTATR